MHGDAWVGGSDARTAVRRGGGIRWWILLLFAGYAAWSWFGNAKTDPYTGEKAHYGATVDEEAQLGLQAFQEVLSARRSRCPPRIRPRRQIETIARRLVARAAEVESANWRRNIRLPSPDLAKTFEWSVAVLQSDRPTPSACPAERWRSTPA